MKVLRVINFEVTDIIETDEFDVKANERSTKVMAANMKQIFDFDDVLVTSHKAFLFDNESTRVGCDSCIHCDSDRFEFPCNECARGDRDKPTMYINIGEYNAKNR